MQLQLSSPLLVLAAALVSAIPVADSSNQVQFALFISQTDDQPLLDIANKVKAAVSANLHSEKAEVREKQGADRVVYRREGPSPSPSDPATPRSSVISWTQMYAIAPSLAAFHPQAIAR